MAATPAAFLRAASRRGDAILAAAIDAVAKVDGEANGHQPSRIFASDPIWSGVRDEADAIAGDEPLLRRLVVSTIIESRSLEVAVAGRVARDLASDVLDVNEIRWEMAAVFTDKTDYKGRPLSRVLRADLSIIKRRDPACLTLAHALLFSKGFAALQSYRFANSLWTTGRQSLALAISSRAAQMYGADFHPAARIGLGLLLDHGTGVVVGETAVIGDFCTLMHGVTLAGACGDGFGDRHPKLCDGVLVGAGAQLLGPIFIGCGAKIGAGSTVLSSVPPLSTVVGSPAKVVGRTLDGEGQILGKSVPDLGLNQVEWLADYKLVKSLWNASTITGLPSDVCNGYLDEADLAKQNVTGRIGLDECRRRVEPLGLSAGDVDAFFFLLDTNGVCVTEDDLEAGVEAFHVIKAGIVGEGGYLDDDALNKMTLKRMALKRVCGASLNANEHDEDEDSPNGYGAASKSDWTKKFQRLLRGAKDH